MGYKKYSRNKTIHKKQLKSKTSLVDKTLKKSYYKRQHKYFKKMEQNQNRNLFNDRKTTVSSKYKKPLTISKDLNNINKQNQKNLNLYDIPLKVSKKRNKNLLNNQINQTNHKNQIKKKRGRRKIDYY